MHYPIPTMPKYIDENTNIEYELQFLSDTKNNLMVRT